MGHLINPISFRLGYSKNWVFSGALMESKSQYFYLNSNYWNVLSFFQRIFNLQTFEKMGIMFSHLRFISTQDSDNIILYLYDGPMQSDSFIFYRYFNKIRIFRKLLKYKRRFMRIFMKRAFYSFYYLNILISFFVMLNKFLIKLIRIKLFNLLNNINFLKFNLKSLDNIFFVSFSNLNIKNVSFFYFIVNFFFRTKVKNLFFSFLLTDISIKSFLNSDYNNSFAFIIMIINSLNNLLNCFNIFNPNKFVLFYNYILNINYFKFFDNSFFKYYINFNRFKNVIQDYLIEAYNMKFLSKSPNENLSFTIKSFLKSFIDLKYNQRLKFYKFIDKFIKSIGKSKKRKFIFLNFFFKFYLYYSTNFFLILRNIINHFKNHLFNKNEKLVSVYFKNISKFEITSSLIARYICTRLRQRFSLKEVLRPILKDLSSNPSIEGFRISCCGRFTKKEIATYRWERKGKISLNTITANIDYAFNYVILKYSVCGIKIWIHRNSNYRYFFRKWFEPFKFFSKNKVKKRFSKNKTLKNRNLNKIIKNKYKHQNKSISKYKKTIKNNKNLNTTENIELLNSLNKFVNYKFLKKTITPFLNFKK